MLTNDASAKSSKSATWLLVIVTLFATITACYVIGRQQAKSLRSNIAERAQTAALAVNHNDIQELTGNSEDIKTAAYTSLNARLAQVSAINDDVERVIIAANQDNHLRFIADDGTASESHHKQLEQYVEAHRTSFEKSIQSMKEQVLGPLSDPFGTYIVGVVPLWSETGESTGILILAANMHQYYKSIALTTLAPALSGLVLITVILFTSFIRRRQAQLTILRSELVSVASHELQSPISGIRWAAEGLLKTRLDDNARRLAQAIHSSATGLQASANDILDLSRALKDRGVTMKKQDITPLIKDLIIAEVLAAKQRGVKIVLDGSWPESLIVNCDQAKLKQALQNLLSNAVKYTRPDTQVTIRYAETEHEHHFLIGDEGIGIPESEQEKVFEGFYRATNAVASKSPGSGLGLYLVRLVIEQQHGHISFVSKEGKGTVFTVTLPK